MTILIQATIHILTIDDVCVFFAESFVSRWIIEYGTKLSMNDNLGKYCVARTSWLQLYKSPLSDTWNTFWLLFLLLSEG